MKNKMELLQAAQKAAAEVVGVVDQLDLHNAKSKAFEALGVCKSHFSDFSQFFESARAAYVSLLPQPVTLAAPAETPAAS